MVRFQQSAVLSLLALSSMSAFLPTAIAGKSGKGKSGKPKKKCGEGYQNRRNLVRGLGEGDNGAAAEYADLLGDKFAYADSDDLHTELGNLYCFEEDINVKKRQDWFTQLLAFELVGMIREQDARQDIMDTIKTVGESLGCGGRGRETGRELRSLISDLFQADRMGRKAKRKVKGIRGLKLQNVVKQEIFAMENAFAVVAAEKATTSLEEAKQVAKKIESKLKLEEVSEIEQVRSRRMDEDILFGMSESIIVELSPEITLAKGSGDLTVDDIEIDVDIFVDEDPTSCGCSTCGCSAPSGDSCSSPNDTLTQIASTLVQQLSTLGTYEEKLQQLELLRLEVERDELCIEPQDVYMTLTEAADSAPCGCGSCGGPKKKQKAKKKKKQTIPPKLVSKLQRGDLELIHVDGEGNVINRNLDPIDNLWKVESPKKSDKWVSWSCGEWYKKPIRKSDSSSEPVELCSDEEARILAMFGGWTTYEDGKWFAEIPEGFSWPRPADCGKEFYGTLSCTAMCTGGCGLSTDKQYDAGVPMVIRAVSQAEGEFLKDEDTNDIITSEDELFTPSSLKLGEISIEEQGCYYGLFQYDNCVGGNIMTSCRALDGSGQPLTGTPLEA